MLPNSNSVVVGADDTNRLRAAAQQFMQIDDTTAGEGKDYALRFRGRLTQDSVAAYALAAKLFREAGYTPLFRPDGSASKLSDFLGRPLAVIFLRQLG